MPSGKILVAQGGGPTAVINQSLVGVVLEARRHAGVRRVYGARHGVRGIVNEDFVDLTQETTHNLELVAATPAAALGSTRDKPDLAYCQEMFKVLAAHEIEHFFNIGGNDSSDTVRIVAEEAAKAGGCGLLNVELDRRPGEEAPRVTIKSIQSFETLARRTRLQIEVTVDGADALPALAAALADHRGGNGQLRLRAPVDGGGEADLILGRGFILDAELAARIERVPGVTSVALAVAEQPRLALVS